jgi:hypothetical protein
VTTQAVRHAPMLTLRELVDRYIGLAEKFSTSVPLTAFALSQAEVERVFSSYEEDYHIGRFFHFSEADGPSYRINGAPATHVALDSEIASIL